MKSDFYQITIQDFNRASMAFKALQKAKFSQGVIDPNDKMELDKVLSSDLSPEEKRKAIEALATPEKPPEPKDRRGNKLATSCCMNVLKI